MSAEPGRLHPRLPRARPAAGFTLIEMLVTLAILGFALVLITAYKAPWSTRLDLDGAAAQLAQELRLARAEAIARDRPVQFALDLRRHSYRVGDGPVRPLPAHLAVQMLTIAGERLGSDAAAIRFNPDGSATGGRISLSAGPRQIAVGVDWLTGRVSVAEMQ